MIVGGEKTDDIDEVLKPPDGIFPEFDSSVDVYFDFDSRVGTSLVLIPEIFENSAHVAELIIDGETIDIPDLIDEYLFFPIIDNAAVTFITEAGISIVYFTRS